MEAATVFDAAAMQTEVIQNNMVFQLADNFRDLLEKKARLEEELTEINKQIEATEEALAFEMINEENPRFTRRGKTFYLTEKLYTSSIAEKRDELHRWMKDNGFGSLIKEYIFPSTLKGFVKEQLEENGELPEGIKDCISYVKRSAVGMRKASTK